MKIALCSHFRNSSSAGHLDRYLAQIDALWNAPGFRRHELTCVWGVGDSTDDTVARLLDPHLPVVATVIDVTHGGPVYGSVVHPQRFKQLSFVCNAIWKYLPEDADAVVWAESDLIWTPETMIALLGRLERCPAVAPMIFHRDTQIYYDVWGCRKNGEMFRQHAPYFDGWPVNSNGMVQVDSAGSVLALRGDVARSVTWPEEDVIVGLCGQLYEQGRTVWLDTKLRVEHP